MTTISISESQTTYGFWLATVAVGESQDATIEQMDTARRALACRADRLSKRGSRRERLALQARYDALLARMLATGWR